MKYIEDTRAKSNINSGPIIEGQARSLYSKCRLEPAKFSKKLWLAFGSRKMKGAKNWLNMRTQLL